MNKSIADQLIELGLADHKPPASPSPEKRRKSSMACPKCDSQHVYEISNLHMIWGCDDCGFQGDGADFDKNME